MSIKDKILTITEASERFDITRQAIVLAIKAKRLDAVKVKGKWRFSEKDWYSYLSSKYDRKHSLRDGVHLYDLENGMLSPGMVAKEFGVKTQHLYYLIRKRFIPYSKNGPAYILKRNEMIKHRNIIMDQHTRRLSCR